MACPAVFFCHPPPPPLAYWERPPPTPAVGLAELFCGPERCVVILGDNIFHDPLGPLLAAASRHPDHAWVALKRVPDPGRYGVAELRDGRVVAIEEKPERPKSDCAVAG